MNEIGKPERETPQRLTTLFRGELGYKYLGNWNDRDDKDGCMRRHDVGSIAIAESLVVTSLGSDPGQTL